MNLASKIESLLFVASKPLSLKKISELLEKSSTDIKDAVDFLKEKYNQAENGIQLMQNDNELQLITNPENSRLVKEYIRDEATSDLTHPALEALTIIAYRGPISKLELEQIRGVNCSLILRNLLMRGLIQEEEENSQTIFSISFDFLKFLGIREINELPSYEKLHSDNLIDRLLAEQVKENSEDI